MTNAVTPTIAAPFAELALIEPDIAGNSGTMLRTAACFGLTTHIVEPCGFAFGDRALRRAGMDYAGAATLVRHRDRAAFLRRMATTGRRMVLLTTQADTDLYDVRFAHGDVLVMGSEGSGVPADIHAAAAIRARIPMRTGFRSLNVAVAAGIAIGEAYRQLVR